MNYVKINKNDTTNGEGVCVSLFVSGCPHHCPGCFNQETWDYNAGEQFTWNTINEIKESINKNNVLRNLSILGGEPLAPQNRVQVASLISEIRKTYEDNIKIYLWTGYTYEDLIHKEFDGNIDFILKNINFLIDGPFVQEKKDIILKLRGSSNQRIINCINVKNML